MLNRNYFQVFAAFPFLICAARLDAQEDLDGPGVGHDLDEGVMCLIRRLQRHVSPTRASRLSLAALVITPATQRFFFFWKLAGLDVLTADGSADFSFRPSLET